MDHINPKTDIVFKKLFGSEENKEILRSLINAILPADQQLVQLTLQNPYSISAYLEGKLSIFDIKAQDEKGRHYDIEMQVQPLAYYGRRAMYYWSRMFSSQLDVPDEELNEKRNRVFKHWRGYDEINKCIVISLLDFSYFPDERYHRCFVLKDLEDNSRHAELDYMDLYFVELSKMDKDIEDIRTALDRWILFINRAGLYRSYELPQQLYEIPEIYQAATRLDVMRFTSEERVQYEGQHKYFLNQIAILQALHKKALEEVEQLSIQKGMEEGIQKGMEEGKRDMARRMKSEGLPPDLIVKLTGLSQKNLEAID